MSYFKDNIEGMRNYVPGFQPKGGDVIKLNTNENPYPPSPGVKEVLDSMQADALRMYPDPTGRGFAAAVSEVIGLPADWILPGNGSDNLIVMVTRACGGPVVVPSPTFPYYETQARVEGVEYVEVPFEDGFVLPVGALIEAAGAITFVANPNSPSGTAATPDRLDELARGLSGTGLLVVDEAYADFADFDALGLVRERDNVIVLRTLSKGYSLAGLRLGFAVARPELLAGLDKAGEIYNVGAITQAAGIAAVRDQAHKDANVEKIRKSRENLRSGLEELGWEVVPSCANFLLASPPGGDAEQFCDRLKERSIFVRYFNRPDLRRYLRITIGTDQQNNALLEALRDIQGGI
jgi:histidinol-phosphate aminotransferase